MNELEQKRIEQSMRLLGKAEPRPIDELIPYQRNQKNHDDRQIKNVAASLRRFGWRQPVVVDARNVIVIGHCRVLAAKLLGLETAPVISAEDLSEDEIRELRIVDNKTNESPWNEYLDEDVQELEFEGFDFDFDEESGGGVDTSDIIEDEPLAPPDEPETHRGDVWQLGQHRLICGDALLIDDINKLLDGNVADCVVTDPPYNMAYEGAGGTQNRAANRIMNDHMPEEDFQNFIKTALGNYYLSMKDGATLYCFYKELGAGTFLTATQAAGLHFRQELVWVKNQLVLGGAKYQNMYEPCIMASKGKRIATWNGGRKERSVIESIDLMNEDDLRAAIRDLLDTETTDVLRENKPLKNDLHPTMKPIRLLAKLILNSSNEGDAVMDLFGGSGSTLIACEQTGRRCFTMELDPKYCDVIIHRWENFTGQKAVLLN